MGKIEIPNWTTCKNWNKDGKIEGSLCAIVEDDYQYFELPYWNGNRPESKELVPFCNLIYVKDDNNKTITFGNCEQYLSNYYGENSLECPNVSEWENLKLITLQIKLSYKDPSQLYASDILFPPIST